MKKNGFTLIELMAVMGIIGLLAAIALPSYASYRVKANNAVAISELHFIVLMETNFYADNSVYADYTIADKNINGNINKTVTVNGSSYNFSAFNFSQNVDSMVKNNGTAQASIIAVRSIGGDVIIAAETEQSFLVRKKISHIPLADSDIPTSTENIDLTTASSWSNW